MKIGIYLEQVYQHPRNVSIKNLRNKSSGAGDIPKENTRLGACGVPIAESFTDLLCKKGKVSAIFL